MVGQGSDEFLFIIGSVSGFARRCKVLGKMVDVRIFEAESIQNLVMRLKVEEC